MTPNPAKKITQITSPLLKLLAILGGGLLGSQLVWAQSTYTWTGRSHASGHWIDPEYWVWVHRQ